MIIVVALVFLILGLSLSWDLLTDFNFQFLRIFQYLNIIEADKEFGKFMSDVVFPNQTKKAIKKNIKLAEEIIIEDLYHERRDSSLLSKDFFDGDLSLAETIVVFKEIAEKYDLSFEEENYTVKLSKKSTRD